MPNTWLDFNSHFTFILGKGNDLNTLCECTGLSDFPPPTVAITAFRKLCLPLLLLSHIILLSFLVQRLLKSSSLTHFPMTKKYKRKKVNLSAPSVSLASTFLPCSKTTPGLVLVALTYQHLQKVSDTFMQNRC